ncbi:MAG: Gfo/Idh/MocA family oxidoreductase [Phycisphaerae bacterium]|nr:Gfo/Idh/MocA family oxidoreductase [Phycisphaerae bacterium]
MSADSMRIGIVGCGGFARFAVGHFLKLPGVSVTAMCEPEPNAAKLGAEAFGIPNVADVETLVRRDDVDLVYIATPPALHHPQGLAALKAGKHVICEKPLAVSNEQADELITTAHERDRLLVANLMQRYNPIYDAVKSVLDSGLLGDVLHGFLENYACDEQLSPQHWFWDPKLSGRIFIEHGVHFFDMFEGWLGPGKVVAAQTSRRAGGQEDQVQCTIEYPGGVYVNHYHGFTQPGPFDRQMFRLLCERGDITLHEWVPTKMVIHALVDDAALRQLTELLPGVKVDTLATYTGEARKFAGRHKTFAADRLVDLTLGEDADKMVRYGEILQGMFTDLRAWILDHSHQRKITEDNGRNSVRMAVAATRLTDEM